MIDFESMTSYECMHIIEALRSGISSRSVGEYFSSARHRLINKLDSDLDKVCENKTSDGIIISGKYGEGKTHFLNTAFNIAHNKNMVVSIISLSKETPFDKLYHVYSKLLNHTYLPKRLQPGFEHELAKITPNSDIAIELLNFTKENLQTDKLHYLFKSYLNTDNVDERFLLQADLDGDFISNIILKQIYKRIFNENIKYNQSFSKTKHMEDYISMLSNLFLQLGYSGWLILFDETELIGKLGKKARLNAYKNMAGFLFPKQSSKLISTYSIFALSASYIAEVIEAKKEYENLETTRFDDNERDLIKKSLASIIVSEQLQPLTEDELIDIFSKVKQFHEKAYNWQSDIKISEILNCSKNGGYLLRNRIRASVEYLDQFYQYGNASDISFKELSQEEYDENLPDLSELF